MTDDMRLLLRILLEQELREAEPEIRRNTPRQNKKAERKIPFPRSHVICCGIHSVRG